MKKVFLRWNEFETNTRESFRDLRKEENHFDVTLASDDGYQIEAHKIVISAGSRFFSEIFRRTKHPSPFLYLKGIKKVELEYVIDFLYNGEAYIAQEELNTFLETAQELQIKGLQTNHLYISGQNHVAKTNSELDLQLRKQNANYRKNLFSVDSPEKVPNTVAYTDIAIVKTEEDNLAIMDQTIEKNECSHQDVSEINPNVGMKSHLDLPFREKETNHPNESATNSLEELDDTLVNKDVGLVNIEEYNRVLNKKIEYDLQIEQMLEKSQGMWHCKVCGRTSKMKGNIKNHIETHIDGVSHTCHICNKTAASRHSLRAHIDNNHSELSVLSLSCDLCDKSGMNKLALRNHKARNHRMSSVNKLC